MNPLRRYLLGVRQAIRAWAGVRIEQYQEQRLTATRANLRMRLRLADHSLLEISEALLAEEGALTWLSYRYHWQDPSGHAILRYDDAPHYPAIATFPHHKHVGETVIAAQRPALRTLLAEIQRLSRRC